MISLEKCSGSYNGIRSPKIFVPKEKNNINVKAVNLITNKNEAQAMKRYISYDCKCKFNSTICNSNQKWNSKTYQCESENYHKPKKDYT